MQRCASIVTSPSSRAHVARAGHTLTQGGLSQWLQKTGTGWPRRAAVMVSASSAAKARSNGSFQIHFTSWRASAMSGTLCARWHASMHARQPPAAMQRRTSIAMPSRWRRGRPAAQPRAAPAAVATAARPAMRRNTRRPALTWRPRGPAGGAGATWQFQHVTVTRA